MQKYECPCGYVYDPAEGDPENRWVCPKCGAEKEYFEPVD